jgi:hypothetical protein
MRKSLRIVTLLFVAGCVPAAYADTVYTLAFNATSGIAPSSATFDYNGTMFVSPDNVSWDGQSFNFLDGTSPDIGLNNPSVITPAPACVGTDTGAQASVDLLTNCGTLDYRAQANPGLTYTLNIYAASLAGIGLYEQIGQTSSCSGSCIVGVGTASGAISSTPEPGSGILLLSGIGLLGLVMRKHIGQRLPQAS